MNEITQQQTDGKAEVSFTPGPWIASKGAEDEPDRWLVTAGGDMPWIIATIENGQPGDCLETEGATAHLIAAAPDLLRAVEVIRAYVPLRGNLNDGKRIVSLKLFVDEVLAKALGKEGME